MDDFEDVDAEDPVDTQLDLAQKVLDSLNDVRAAVHAALDHLDRLRELKSLGFLRKDLDHAFALVGEVNSARVAAETNLHRLSRTIGE